MASLNYKTEDGSWKKIAGGKTGVLTFKGRAGVVTPKEGDYTAEMVGARPNTWMPNIAEVGGVNPNLLDNWYFKNPVNQRSGELVVPPNTPWFTSLSFETEGGRTDGYYVYTPYNDICGSIQIGDVTGYVAVAYLIHRYTDTGYAFDRWYAINGGTLTGEGYKPMLDIGNRIIQQPLEDVLAADLKGKTVTLSVLLKNGGLLSATGTFPFSLNIGGVILAIDEKVWPQKDRTIFRIWVISPTDDDTIIAAKLELGSTQTLAHQENGVWVLNEIPDYGEELRKCQRYFVRYGSNEHLCNVPAIVTAATGNNYPNFLIATPVPMRANPGLKMSGVIVRTLADLTDHAVTDGYTAQKNANGVVVALTTDGNVSVSGVPLLRTGQSGYLELSADL